LRLRIFRLMLTHASRLRANETDREAAIHRSVQRATGNGCALRLHESEVPRYAHRVRMYAHLRGVSAETVLSDLGIGGAAQVVAALEAE
jgi:hypothetical protein